MHRFVRYGMVVLTSLSAFAGCCCPEPTRTTPEPPRGWEPTSDIDRTIMLTPCDSVPPDTSVVDDLTGGDTFENEIHDCQRVVMEVDDTLRYGPLLGVFPLDDAMQFDDSAFAGVGQPIATIYNWGGRGRTLDESIFLKIGPGWHCLWLRDSASTWQAAVTSADSVGCAHGGSSVPTEWQLAVRRTGAMTHIELPPTARFDWDHGNQRPFIGIKCGSLWCAIGGSVRAPGFLATTTIAPSLPMGLVDGQHLAVIVDGELRPGPWAVIAPTDTLRQLRHADPAAGEAAFAQGVDVATIAVLGSDFAAVAPYHTKFNLADSAGAFRTTINLTLADDNVAQFRNASMPPKTSYHVGRMIVEQHAAPGAVRWRWHDTDESAWVSCRAGCCDIQP